ncbi:MAG: tRNA (guanosine(37)-N1)-methyltransferase TrmD, partial [Leptospiraceae bacterium]|nr:tRNA (guanosine(37)-N1)-methyltransferase TrmD [Leptospiraceae bacterium]
DRALAAMERSLPVILFTPRGERLNQSGVRRFYDQARNHAGLTLVCGYYEGVDERIARHLVDYEVSLGDFILGSGDLAALCFIEAITRLIPGYMGSEESAHEESNENGLLEYPQYTRPADYNGWKVPDVLLSGHHGEIERWRLKESHRITEYRNLKR